MIDNYIIMVEGCNIKWKR